MRATLERLRRFVTADRLLRVLLWTAWGVLVVVVLGMIAWTFLNVLGSARFESVRSELEAAGYATRADRLGLPEAPAGENAAPFYSAAFALFVEVGDDEAPWDQEPRLRIEDLSPKQRAKLERWLEANADAFEMVQRARKRPRCRFPRDYREGYSMLLPELSKVMSMTRALAFRAELQALQGDAAGARDSVRSLLEVGHSLREDAILVSHLVRLVAIERAVEAVDACVTAVTGAADLREWRAVVPPDSAIQGGQERGYRGELAILAGLAGRPAEEFWELTTGRRHMPVAWLLKPVIRLDGAAYLHDLRRMIEATRKPYLEARDAVPAVDAGRLNPALNPVRSALLPSFGRSLGRDAEILAWLAVARAGLDAELAQRTTGSYPAAIGEIDPFTGKPLVPDLKAGTISSVGPPTKSVPPIPIEWKLRPKKS